MTLEKTLSMIDPFAVIEAAPITRDGPGTYYDKTGTLKTAAANVPRVTYDPSDLSKAPYLMIEPAATNNCLNSQQLNAWAFSYQVTIASDAIAAPDGTMTADKLVNNGPAEQSIKAAVFNFVAGVTYTASIYGKAGEVSAFTGTLSSALVGTGGGHATFDAASGTVSSASANVTGKPQKVGNGWWRFSWTFTATASSSLNALWIDLGMASADTTKGMYFWGAQLEVGSVATSYIPATSAPVTRAADVIPSGLIPAATNLATDSQGFTTGWSGSVSVAASPATFPDTSGPIQYKTLAKTAATTNEGRTCSLGAVAAGQTLAETIALRAGNSTSVTVGLYCSGGGDAYGPNSGASAVILAGPGTVTQQGGGKFDIAGLTATDDTLVEITRTFSVNGTAEAWFYPGGSASTTIGQSSLATRVQVELNQPTPYIPTTNAAVTRAASTVPTTGLIYSSLSENDVDDAPLYDPTKTYAAGDFVRRATTHRVYESAAAGNLGNTPENNVLGSTAKWVDVRPTNRYAMFDAAVDTSSVAPIGTDLVVVLRPGPVDSIYGVIDADMAQACVQDAPGGNVILNFSETLEASAPADWDEYFWAPFKPLPDFLITGIDPYYACVVTITLSKSGASPTCAGAALGYQSLLGSTQHGVEVNPRTNAYTKTDDYGITRLKQRPSTNDLSGSALLDRSEASYVNLAIRNVLAKPVVVIASDDPLDFAERAYGLLSAKITYAGNQHAQLSFNVQGVVNAVTDTTT